MSVQDQPAHADVALEKNLLGACLLGPQHIPDAARHVRRQDFYWTQHADLWDAACAAHEQHGDATDWILVADHLAAAGGRTSAYTPAQARALAEECTQRVAVAANAPLYAERLAALGTKRRLTTAARRLALDEGDETTALAQLEAAILERRAAGHGAASRITTQTWSAFQRDAQADLPVLIRGLWPAGAFGFIAGPPKSRKTWLGLNLALSLATGKPLLGRFAIPNPQPVLYVALEGHASGIRTRIGCLARGLGLNPDSPLDLESLHLAYKPRGINLADRAWAADLAATARHLDAALVIVDVLRAAAQIDENSARDFAQLRHNLEPLADDGRSVCLLHHFGKLSEANRDRDAGDRMAGSGAMRGAGDILLYLTGSRRDPASRLEIEARDLAEPDPIGFVIDGHGSGENGGYTYTDACRLVVAEAPEADRSVEVTAEQIAEYVRESPEGVAPGVIAAHFGINRKTLGRRRERLEELGVGLIGYTSGARYRYVLGAPVAPDPAWDTTRDTPPVPCPESQVDGSTMRKASNLGHLGHEGVSQDESADLQGERLGTRDTPPYGGVIETPPSNGDVRATPSVVLAAAARAGYPAIDHPGRLEIDPGRSGWETFAAIATPDEIHAAHEALELLA